MEYLRLIKPVEKIKNNITLRYYQVYNDGGCQCFKDCDCYKKRGITAEFSKYKHNKSKTLFDTLAECESDLENELIKLAHVEKIKSDAINWFNSLSNKEQNRTIDLYRGKFKQKQAHASIKANKEMIFQMHRTLLKNDLL